MLTGPYLRKNFSLAWPLAFNAVLMQSMLMIDTLLVSPLGETSLAAMAIAATIVAFILGIQLALANGSQLVISRAVGSGVNTSTSKAFLSGMIINILAAFLFWTLLAVFQHQIISLLTDDSLLHQQISDYLSISQYLIFFTAVTQVIIALFNGLGKTQIAFKGYLIELPLNVIFSYLLIYGVSDFQGIGVQGAAIGSLLGIAVRLCYLVLSLHLMKNFSLTLNSQWQTLYKNIKQHFNEIFPVAANLTMLSIGATVYQILYSQLSINSYVAITLVLPWITAGTQFITAWSQSTAIIISQAIGAQNFDGFKKNIDLSINVAVFVSIICALLFALFSFFIGDIYTELDDATYQALSIIAPLYIVLPIVRGYVMVHGHVLRALGKTTAVFKINFTVRWLIALPLLAVFILYFDISIFWAFALQPIEELIKVLPLRHLARKYLKEFDADKAKQLMYD